MPVPLRATSGSTVACADPPIVTGLAGGADQLPDCPSVMHVLVTDDLFGSLNFLLVTADGDESQQGKTVGEDPSPGEDR